MARVVIDIPDEDFSLLCEAFGEVELKSTLNLRLQSAVAHGTVLPKGHGDLIDRKALRKAINEEGNKWVMNTEYDSGRFDGCDYIDFLAANAPTVIEADKEKADENS